MPPSPMTGMPARARLRRIANRGELRNADAGHDARRADRARADADLHAGYAGLDQRLGALRGRDVATDQRQIREGSFELANRLEDAREWPCAVSTTTTSTPASTSA